MSNLETAIEQIKAIRNANDDIRPWIYNQDGEISEDAIIIDSLKYIEALKDYEIDASDDDIKRIMENAEKATNTYNYGSLVSEHLSMYILQEDGKAKVAYAAHLFGDIRANYSKAWACEFSNVDEPFNLDEVFQTKTINERYSADMNMFSDVYSVYDNETGLEAGTGLYYETDKNELLNLIQNEHTDFNPEEEIEDDLIDLD